jgi:hypothetical protein
MVSHGQHNAPRDRRAAHRLTATDEARLLDDDADDPINVIAPWSHFRSES